MPHMAAMLRSARLVGALFIWRILVYQLAQHLSIDKLSQLDGSAALTNPFALIFRNGDGDIYQARCAIGGWSGLQRLQARKPAATASPSVRWNATFSRRAGRAAQDGRQ